MYQFIEIRKSFEYDIIPFQEQQISMGFPSHLFGTYVHALNMMYNFHYVNILNAQFTACTEHKCIDIYFVLDQM